MINLFFKTIGERLMHPVIEGWIITIRILPEKYNNQ